MPYSVSIYLSLNSRGKFLDRADSAIEKAITNKRIAFQRAFFRAKLGRKPTYTQREATELVAPNPSPF